MNVDVVLYCMLLNWILFSFQRGKQQPQRTKPFLNKKISFMTSLDEVEPVRSSKYEGPIPVSWRKGGSRQTAKIGPVPMASYAESQSITTKYVRI